MKKVFVLWLYLFTVSGGALAQVDTSQDPPVQAGEDVSDFKKGWGNGPSNGNSKFFQGVKMRPPVLGGTGCQAGTVSATLTPDNKTVSILFDNYIAQAGASFGVRRDVKSCAVVIPIDVPADSQFAVVKMEYSGFNSIPANARTRYVTMYSVVDGVTNQQIGPRVRRRFDFAGPLNESYVLSADVSVRPVWSACGKSTNFRIDTRAMAISNNRGEDVMATIDSIDAVASGGGESNVEYHLLWQSCQTEVPPVKGGPGGKGSAPGKKPGFGGGFGGGWGRFN